MLEFYNYNDLALCFILSCRFPSIANSCNNGQWQCVDGQCINVNYVCDGVDDCNDRSDEQISQCRVQSESEFITSCNLWIAFDVIRKIGYCSNLKRLVTKEYAMQVSLLNPQLRSFNDFRVYLHTKAYNYIYMGIMFDIMFNYG